jgi:hypothetical protein
LRRLNLLLCAGVDRRQAPILAALGATADRQLTTTRMSPLPGAGHQRLLVIDNNDNKNAQPAPQQLPPSTAAAPAPLRSTRPDCTAPFRPEHSPPWVEPPR